MKKNILILDYILKCPEFFPPIFPAEQTLQLFVLRVKVNRKKTQIKSMADHVRFNPILRLWLPDYLLNKINEMEGVHRDKKKNTSNLDSNLFCTFY